MSTINLKHGKEEYNLDIEAGSTVEAFKNQVWNLTQVPVGKQKFIGFPGGMIQDTDDLGEKVAKLKPGAKITLLGAAEPADAEPPLAKAAPPPPAPAMPKKRGWGDDDHGGPPSPDQDSKRGKGYPPPPPGLDQGGVLGSKAAGPPPPGGKDNGNGKGGKGGNYYVDPPTIGAGAPTSKAKWPQPSQEKGADQGGSFDKGGFPDKGKGKVVKGLGSEGKGADYGKMGGFDAGDYGKGGKDFGKGDNSGKGGKGGEASVSTAATPEERKQALQADRLLSAQAQTSIEFFKTNGVDIELGLLSKKLVPGDEARRSAQRCLALVRSAVSAHWGQHSGPDVPSISMSGSHAQGTEVHGSAMELAFRLPASFSFDDRANAVSELRNRLSQQTNFLEVCNTLQHYPHTISPLAIDLAGAEPGMVAHVVLEELRVNRPPTLDEVIKQCCDSFEASYDLVRLVKVWTVNHGLANHQEGFINGVAWTLLVIFFLQKSGFIKPYSVLSKGGQGPPSVSSLPLSSLLQNFLDFLSQRNEAPRGISVWKGVEFEGPSAVFVEDPAHFLETGTQRSVSETLGEQQWNRIMEEAKKAFNRIKVRPGRWFHWAEIFDPSDRKPAKILGLGAHLGAPLNAGKGSAPPPPPVPPAKGDGKGSSDGKGPDAKGMGKDDGKGAPWAGSGKDNSKGCSKGEGKDAPWSGSGKDDSKGSADGKGTSSWSGKDSDGKGSFGKDSSKDSDKGWSGKDSGSKGGKDSDKGYGKDYSGGKDSSGKDYSAGTDFGGGKDSGKGTDYGSGKDYGGGKESSGGKDYGSGKDYGGGKDYGKGKDYGGGKDYGSGKDYGKGKGYGKPY